jgi:Zn-finger nucleic acid-binding protein
VNTCPKCRRELILFEYEGVELLQCSECNGFWFSNETFRQAKRLGFAGLYAEKSSESFSERSSGVQADEDMLCPECSTPLSAYNYAYSSDIQLHRCAQCNGIWAEYPALLEIERLLTSYKESLDEAKAKAIPLMLQVKEQIQQEEIARKEERKRRKKQGFFNRLFGKKESQARKIEDIFEDFHTNNNIQS